MPFAGFYAIIIPGSHAFVCANLSKVKVNMKYKTITTLAAILSLLNACFFLLAPVFSLSLLGRETNITGIMNTRISGACALGLGIITWMARDSTYPEVRRMVTYGLLITFLILVVIDLHGVITGAVNGLGWVIFFADLFLSLGFILSIFTDGGRHK
jgi:uncharacterized membrane protein